MTAAIRERDLCRVRLRLLDLFKSLFVAEPNAERLGRWRGIFGALAKAEVGDEFAGEAGIIAGLLWENSLSELQDEYYRVFADPFAEKPVAMTASCYQNGRNYGEALADVRGFMAEAGLARDPAETTPEDGLVALLDILVALIEEEKTGEERAGELAGRLLAEFLVPLAEQLAAALQDNENAFFYAHCGRLLCSYLDLEMGLLVEEG